MNNDIEYCNNECNQGKHEIVYCVKCNKRMNPCDLMPNPIEYGTNEWICDECMEMLE